MPALLTWTPEDGVLGAVAPIALAMAHATSLVVDLDPLGPRYPGEMTLARLVAVGPRRADLEPRRRGVAVLPNGGVEPEEAIEVVSALVAGWPAVVIRLPQVGPPRVPDGLNAPVVPIRPLLPADMLQPTSGAVVWQGAGWRVTPPGPGPVLPRARAATVRALLDGVRPRRDRWLSAFAKVWDWPWH